MISHVTLGITDFERAMAFYAPVLQALGLRLRFRDAARPWAAWQPAEATGDGRAAGRPPLFIITAPLEGEARPGNGAMVALTAPDRAAVRAAHDAGLRHGGTSEGAPGLRPAYHPDYYGAYLRCPDGNKLCLVCHDPDG